MAPTRAALDYFAALVAKVDQHFERVRSRYPEALRCGGGCADCCVSGLSVTRVEAHSIAEVVAALAPAARRALSARLATSGDRCPALDAELHCVIYPRRPLVCRSHGAPIRTGEDQLEVCPENFVGVDLAGLDADCVVDQNTLSTMLAAVDAAFAEASGAPRGIRIALVNLLRDPARCLEGEPL